MSDNGEVLQTVDYVALIQDRILRRHSCITAVYFTIKLSHDL